MGEYSESYSFVAEASFRASEQWRASIFQTYKPSLRTEQKELRVGFRITG